VAAKPLDKVVSEKVVADWRTGAYSQQKLADKYNVSKGAVNKLCKNVDQDMTDIVTAGVQYKCGLASQDDRIVTAVTELVDERTKHIEFFTSAAIKNVKDAMTIACENQNDFRARADTILKGREAVLGKAPDTAIQINNNSQQNTEKQVFSTDPIEAAKQYQRLMG